MTESRYSSIKSPHRVCGVMLTAISILLGPSASRGASACSYAVYVASLGMTARGGGLTVSIQTGSDCTWSVTGLPDWLTVSATQGTGSAEVSVAASNNSGPTRVGVFTVAGVSVPVHQFDTSACPEGTTCLYRPVPHVAFGGVWTTDLFAINWATHGGVFSISFYDDNGLPVAVPFTGGSGKLSTLIDSVPALGRTDYEISDASAPIQSGWAEVTADSSIETQAIFRSAVPSGTYYEAAVPTGEAYSQFLVPFDTTMLVPSGRPLYTAFAIVNLNPLGAANLVCSARDASGAQIPDALTIPALKPLGHYAAYLSGALMGKRGTLECNSDTLISAIALRFIGEEAFSTLPVILTDP